MKSNMYEPLVRRRYDGSLDNIFDRMTQDRREDRLPDIDAVLQEFYTAFPTGDWLRKGDLILWSESGGSAKPAPAPETPPQA